MKKVLVSAMLLIVTTVAFSQQTIPSTAPTRHEYLSKSTEQLVFGSIFLGIGGTCLIIASGGNVSFDGLGILVVGGGLATIASIPLFIASMRNKRKANAMSAGIKMEKADMVKGYSMKSAFYPAVSIRIKLQ